MVGEGCFAVASDKRLGQQALAISNQFSKIFSAGQSKALAMAGLATDISSLSESILSKLSHYELTHGCEPSLNALGSLLGSQLYKKRFAPWMVECVCAGFNSDGDALLVSTDCVGCTQDSKDYVAIGSARESLHGTCEGLWHPGMSESALFETISQAMVNAMDRDALSGWGADVWVVTPKRTVKRSLKTRQD